MSIARQGNARNETSRIGDPDAEIVAALYFQQLPQDVRQDSAIFVIENFLGRVDPYDDRELYGRAGRALGNHDQAAAGREPLGEALGRALDGVELFAGEAEALDILAG